MKRPFTLSEQSRTELDTLSADEWRKAVQSVPSCKRKDATILKLYFTCLRDAKTLCEDIDNEQLFLVNV